MDGWKDGIKHTCLHSSRVCNRRAACASGRSGKADEVVVVVAEADCCTVGVVLLWVVVLLLASASAASGSVTLVSWDVLMTAELSNSELASGEMDRG